MHQLTQFIANLNSQFSRKRLVCEVQKTSNILRFLKVLRQLNFIYGYTTLPASNTISVYLRYSLGRPAISGITPVTRPSARRYVTTRKLLDTFKKDPATLVVLSTSLGFRGLVTRHKSGLVGGEFICKVW